MADPLKTPWVLVAGDFRPTGGMDKANRVLAKFLLDRGTPVHLVTHFADKELASHPLVTVHNVPKPLGSYFLGGPLLDRKGRALWRQLKRQWPGTTIVANGGNCLAEGINWSHFVQRAWNPDLSEVKWRYRLRWAIERRWEIHRERVAYRRARLVITNSDMTSADVRRCLAAEQADKVRRVYLGSESEWEPVSDSERAGQRRIFEVAEDRQLALFVGSLSADNRKGFDVIVRAWKMLCEDPQCKLDLWVAGTGPGLSRWQAYFDECGLRDRIRLLGYRNDIRELLNCADVLVSVPRYEPYGLNIQEALACGVPVIASTKAGVAERFPAEMRALLTENPDDPDELRQRLLTWQAKPDYWRQLATAFGRELCKRSWNSMAREMVDLIERDPTTPEPVRMPQTCEQN